MSGKNLRYDGIGMALLGLAALIAVVASISGFIRAPVPENAEAVQQSMAWANWVMVWVSLGGGLIGAISLFLIYGAYLESKRSADAAERNIAVTREIGVKQTRAYLSVNSVKLTVDPDDVVAEIEVVVTNSGQSPALNVKAAVELILTETYDFDESDPLYRQKGNARWADVHAGSAAIRSMLVTEFDGAFLRAHQKLHPFTHVELILTTEFEDVFDQTEIRSTRYWCLLTYNYDLSQPIELQRDDGLPALGDTME